MHASRNLIQAMIFHIKFIRGMDKLQTIETHLHVGPAVSNPSPPSLIYACTKGGGGKGHAITGFYGKCIIVHVYDITHLYNIYIHTYACTQVNWQPHAHTLTLLKERAVTRLSHVVVMPTMWRGSRMVDSRKYYQDAEAGEWKYCTIMSISEN